MELGQWVERRIGVSFVFGVCDPRYIPVGLFFQEYRELHGVGMEDVQVFLFNCSGGVFLLYLFWECLFRVEFYGEGAVLLVYVFIFVDHSDLWAAADTCEAHGLHQASDLGIDFGAGDPAFFAAGDHFADDGESGFIGR